MPCDLNPGRKATVHIAYPLPKRVRTPTKVLIKCEVGNARVTEYLQYGRCKANLRNVRKPYTSFYILWGR